MQLCAEAVRTTDIAQLDPLMKELQKAIRDHIRLLRQTAVAPIIPERRKSPLLLESAGMFDSTQV